MKSIFGLLLLFLQCFSCLKEEGNEYDPYIKGSIIGYAMLTKTPPCAAIGERSGILVTTPHFSINL